jgi:hypothetical protein
MHPERRVPRGVGSAWRTQPNTVNLPRSANVSPSRPGMDAIAPSCSRWRRFGYSLPKRAAVIRLRVENAPSQSGVPASASCACASRSQTCAIWMSTARDRSSSVVRAISRHSWANRRYSSDLGNAERASQPDQFILQRTRAQARSRGSAHQSIKDRRDADPTCRAVANAGPCWESVVRSSGLCPPSRAKLRQFSSACSCSP